jgi:hypothetical protein
VRVRAVLKKSWDAWADDVAKVPGDVRECSRALVHSGRGEGGADSAGPRHRERGRARGGNGSTTGKAGPQSRERRRARRRGNRRRQPGPTGQREGERGRAGEGVAAVRWNPPVRRRGRAGARPGWAELGRLGCFAFFLNFLIAFPFLFSRVFNSNSNSNQVSNSN